MANNNLTNKFTNRMFRKVGDLVWDLLSGNLGINTPGGIVSLTQEGEGESLTFGISVNPIDQFGTSIPAFALNTPLDQVETGDIIVGDSKILGWVIEVRGASLKLLDHSGMTKNYTPPKVAIMGTNGVLVVKNLFNLAGGSTGLAGIQNNLMPLLLLGGAGDSLDKIMPIILMQTMSGVQAPAAGAQANPMASMLPLLLMSKGGKGGIGDIDPMMLMMMGGMGGGAGGINPMMLMALSGGLGGDSEAIELAAPAGIPALNRVARR